MEFRVRASIVSATKSMLDGGVLAGLGGAGGAAAPAAVPAAALAGVGAGAVDDSKIDYRALYFQEAEKNKHLLQWIVQLQSNLSMRLQMIEPRAAGSGSAAPAPDARTAGERPAEAGARPPAAHQAAGAHHGAEGARASPDCPQPGMRAESTRSGSQERHVAQAGGGGGGGGGAARVVSSGAASGGGSSSASPALSHRGGPAGQGHESGLVPEAAQIDLARTTCSKCGQAFAFCAAFLSRHDFLVMPCPKCRCAAAIPPTPLAPTPSATLGAGRTPHWHEAAPSDSAGVRGDGGL